MELKVCSAGILLKDGKILLAKRHADRNFYPNAWDLPGGHCIDGETPEETLIRELKEELGVTIIKFNYLALLHEPKREVYGNYDYHIYSVTDWLGIIDNLAPAEHSELCWFGPDDAVNLELAHPDYPALFKKINASSLRKP